MVALTQTLFVTLCSHTSLTHLPATSKSIEAMLKDLNLDVFLIIAGMLFVKDVINLYTVSIVVGTCSKHQIRTDTPPQCCWLLYANTKNRLFLVVIHAQHLIHHPIMYDPVLAGQTVSIRTQRVCIGCMSHRQIIVMFNREWLAKRNIPLPSLSQGCQDLTQWILVLGPSPQWHTSHHKAKPPGQNSWVMNTSWTKICFHEIF
jgi:hypothetical protein